MSWSFRLLTVQGIPVRVHASFLLILVLAASVGLTSGRGDWLRSAVFMVVFTLLLFVCVVLHELGHSLIAQLFGVQVQDITLWPIGGVARMAKLPQKPYQEFLITVAGPATNLLLAIAFGMLALTAVGPQQMLRILGSPRLLDRFLATTNVRPLLLLLTLNNLILALFNLVPAFPMDGGRLLRSLLAVFLPFGAATRVASSIGQVLAVLMGIFSLFTGNFLLTFVSLFVFMAAWQERRQVMIQDSLQGLYVRQAMQPIGPRLHPHQTLGEAATQAASTPQAAYLVVDGGRLVGALSRGDLLSAVRRAGPVAPVAQHMRRETLQLKPDEALVEALDRLLQAQSAIGVVVESGQVIGTLSRADLLRLAELLSAHPEALPRR